MLYRIYIILYVYIYIIEYIKKAMGLWTSIWFWGGCCDLCCPCNSGIDSWRNCGVNCGCSEERRIGKDGLQLPSMPMPILDEFEEGFGILEEHRRFCEIHFWVRRMIVQQLLQQMLLPVFMHASFQRLTQTESQKTIQNPCLSCLDL